MEGEESILVSSPSFNSYSSSNFAEIAAKVTMEFQEQRQELGLQESDLCESTIEIAPEEVKEVKTTPEVEESDADDDDDDDFEFAVLSRDPNASPISADEIFANGQIKPIYPVFNRDLLFAGGQDDFTDGDTIRLPLRKLMIREERGGEPSSSSSSSSSSESDEIEGLPDGTYCVWTPKPAPETCKKSNSTGSSSRRWRFRNLLHRSNSDGKDTFVFLTPNTTKPKPKKHDDDDKVVKKEKRNSSAETATATAATTTREAGKAKSKGKSGEGSSSASAHEAHYVRNRAMKEGDRRRSYLPYRQDLVGLFANVNGLNRTLRPF